MNSTGNFVAAAVVAFASFAPSAQAQQDPGEWRQRVFLYGMGAAIEGDAQIGDISVPIDVGISDLRVRVRQQRTEASRDASWVDPLVGLNDVVPIGGKWTYTLRGDVCGFGVGSGLTWHMITTFRRQNTDRFAWYVGYRVIAFDYEDDSGRNYQHYDLTQQGPSVGVALSS